MEFLLAMARLIKCLLSLESILSAIKRLATSSEALWLVRQAHVGCRPLRRQTTARRLYSSKAPTLDGISHRLMITIAHYIIATMFFLQAVVYLIPARLHLERAPVFGLFFLLVVLLAFRLGVQYARFGGWSRRALSDEWTRYKKMTLPSYLVLGIICIGPPLAAYLFECLPQLIAMLE